MGKKKAPAEEEAKPKPAEPEKKEEEPEKEEDPPIVKELKAVDDKYLEIEREYERAVHELDKKYDALRTPLFEERLKVLTATSGEEAATTGTPAIKGFWLKALKNLPSVEDQIEEWDEPVLEYLKDITKADIDEDDAQKGFKLTFHFVENPYFTNDVLWKEYYTKEDSPYTGEMDTTEIKASEIDWKSGKNVTVETVKKKVKGGGAKKQKQKNKETAEPRDSFFRAFFRQLKKGDPMPEDVNQEGMDGDSDEDEEEMMDMLMEFDYDMGSSIKDSLIPFAVRWYTGEARPDDEDDEDDEDEEEEEDDDYDEDEDDEDDEPAPKKKPQQKKGGGGGGGGDKKKGGASDEAQPKPEECKQQ